MEKPVISIIICIYNGAKYLESALESIFESDFNNYEVVCINDGSTDESHKICHKYNCRYSNFRYYIQDNHGLAYSRNLGVKLSKGDYITFVDSDDMISPHMLSFLFEQVKLKNTQIAYCELQFFSRESEICHNYNNFYINVCSNREAISYYFRKTFGNVCGGLFHRSLFFNVKFPQGLIYEDNPAKLQLLMNARTVVLSNNPLYFYRKNMKSITNKKMSIQNLDILRIGYLLEEILISNKVKLTDNLFKEYYVMITDIFYNIAEKLLNKDIDWRMAVRTVPFKFFAKILIKGLIFKFNERCLIFIRILVLTITKPRN